LIYPRKIMDRKLPGICFIGCGDIAARHTKIIKKIFPKIEISFASRDYSKAKDFSKKFNGKNSFGNYEEALTSDLFQIGFITTPHAFHSTIAVTAAGNGKDIIIEKPVARNLDELNNITNAVNKNKVRCVVAENYYYKPGIKLINDHIDNGFIGEVLFIDINKTNRDDISGWRTNEEMMGGGALLEGGVHWVNALVSLGRSKPAEVIAFKPEVKYETDVPVEDSLMVCVKFNSGAVGKLLHSWRIPNPLKGLGISKIYGTEGIITFESNGLYVSLNGKKKKRSFISPFSFLGFKTMHEELINAYISGKDWEPSMDRIKAELSLVEAAYKSIKTGKLEKIL